MNLKSLPICVLFAGAVAAQGFGAIYTLDNDASDNSVQVTLRLPNGSLYPFASFATAGSGTGAGLGSQGALAASNDGHVLLAVNPGSNEVTLFRVLFGVFLWRQDVEDTGGVRPTSVAMHDQFVYVLNADSDSVRGFRRQGGNLVPIPGAVYPLSGNGVAAAQVGFSPDGHFLVVTERATDTIDVFRVLPNGRLGAGAFQSSAGPTPFGFQFRHDGALVVSEAAGGAAGASTVSTYRIHPNGMLETLTAAAPTGQSAACWIALAPSSPFAYTTNTGSGTLSGFGLDATGHAMLLDPSGVSGDLGPDARPIDAAFTPDGHFVYVLDAANDRIRALLRRPNGSLETLATSADTPDGSAGMIVR